MKQIKTIILLIATSMLLCACPEKEDGHRYIIIVNQSDKTIVWQPQEIRIGEIKEPYDCRKVIGGSIYSNSSFEFNCDDRGNTWEAELNTHYLQITVMDREVYWQYRTEPCETIRENVPILHTYQLTLEDLQRMNWRVVYPPEE